MDILKCRGVLTLVLALGFVASGINAQGYCEIEIDPANRGFIQPLLMRGNHLLYPELYNGRIIFNIPPGTNLIAACPGDNNGLMYFGKLKHIDLICNAGNLTQSQHPQVVITWGHLECLRGPQANMEEPGDVCGIKGRYYSIGWNIRPNLFIPTILLCFNADEETTEFAIHEVQGKIIGVKMVNSNQRPTFRPAEMFSVNVREDYMKKNEVALFEFLLGTDKYLTGNGEHYLAKGHLAPDSDFFYVAEQTATYFYGNVVPQWQSINNGNWRKLEYEIRRLAERHQATFKIWTGSYSILQLPNLNNNAISMFLGLRERKEKIPVPAFIWKVIYDPTSKEGVAIVSVNNVVDQGYAAPCNDVCGQLNWVNWDTTDIQKGRTFCCHISDLKAAIPTLPNLRNVALLKN